MTPAPAPLRLPDLRRAGALTRFFWGARAALGGIRLTLRTRRLLALCLVPVIVQLGLVVAMGGLAYRTLAPLAGRYSAEGWQSALWHLLLLGIFLGALFLALIVASRLTSVLCDPLFDLIAKRAEALLLQQLGVPPREMPKSEGGPLRELLAAVAGLAVFAFGSSVVALVGLVPVAGAVLELPLGLAWTWLYLCHEFVARNLSQHGIGPLRRIRIVFANKAAALGFGAAAWLCLFIPFLSPFLAVGATELYLMLAAKETEALPGGAPFARRPS